MKTNLLKTGMTLVETLITVAITGLLSALLGAAVHQAIQCRRNTECARKLRTAVAAFELYAAENGRYPAESPSGTVPPEMASYYFPYFQITWWASGTELGGCWDWNASQDGIAFSVSITEASGSEKQIAALDRLVDDGNPDSGNFRKAGAKYHYILKN